MPLLIVNYVSSTPTWSKECHSNSVSLVVRSTSANLGRPTSGGGTLASHGANGPAIKSPSGRRSVHVAQVRLSDHPRLYKRGVIRGDDELVKVGSRICLVGHGVGTDHVVAAIHDVPLPNPIACGIESPVKEREDFFAEVLLRRTMRSMLFPYSALLQTRLPLLSRMMGAA